MWSARSASGNDRSLRERTTLQTQPAKSSSAARPAAELTRARLESGTSRGAGRAHAVSDAANPSRLPGHRRRRTRRGAHRPAGRV